MMKDPCYERVGVNVDPRWDQNGERLPGRQSEGKIIPAYDKYGMRTPSGRSGREG